jgi:hypothetical protein
MESNKETCFTCAKMQNLHISGEKFCEHSHTMYTHNHPVPCVHYKRFPEYRMVYHDKHVWKKASENFAHANGLSSVAWCTKCGAEGASGMPASNRCYDIIITKRYRVGGVYRKSCSKEYLKLAEK